MSVVFPSGEIFKKRGESTSGQENYRGDRQVTSGSNEAASLLLLRIGVG
jgi:hypothetical protein